MSLWKVWPLPIFPVSSGIKFTGFLVSQLSSFLSPWWAAVSQSFNDSSSFTLWSEVKWSRSVVPDSLWPHGACTKLLHPWDFQGKNIGVGCHFLLLNSDLVSNSVSWTLLCIHPPSVFIQYHTRKYHKFINAYQYMSSVSIAL